MEACPCCLKAKTNKSKVEELPCTRDFESSLLELVMENWNVWDHKDSLYQRTKLRQNTYQAIVDTFRFQYPELSDLNGEHVRQKFKNLRTCFLNLSRKIQKAPCGSVGQLTHKGPLLDSSSCLVDSMVDTSDSCSSFSVPVPGESSSEPEIVTSTLQPADVLEIEIPSFEGTFPALSSVSGHQTSLACANLTEAAPHPLLTPSLKRAAGSPNCWRKRIVRNYSVDKYMDGLNDYLQNKQNFSPLAVSLGLFVEAAVDKLPHNRQIWFAQKLTNLIAEANNLPIQTD